MTMMILARRMAHLLRLFLRSDIGQGFRLHIRRIVIEEFHQGEADQKKDQQNSHALTSPVAGIVELLFDTRMN